MPQLDIDLVSDPADIETVRALCRDFVDWQIEAYPDWADAIRAYFAPERYDPVLADLPRIHARPGGGILLARLGGAPAGCVMWLPMAPGVAEVKRLFVTAEARGAGVGSGLVERMLEQARADGYAEMRLETARFLTSAQKLYAGNGFVTSDHASELPPAARSVALYMRRTL